MRADARWTVAATALVVAMMSAGSATGQVRHDARGPDLRGTMKPAVQPPAARGAPADAVGARTTLLALFRGYELVPTEAQLRRLGPALDPSLVDIATDPSLPDTTRARAISTMAYGTAPMTLAALRSLVDAGDTPSLLRRKAILALPWRSTAAEDIHRVEATFLGHPTDIPLREACARALRTAGSSGERSRVLLLEEAAAASVIGLLKPDKDIRR
jgi:hypothetical protein